MMSDSLRSLALCVVAVGGQRGARRGRHHRCAGASEPSKIKVETFARGSSTRGACSSFPTAGCWSRSGWGACVSSPRTAGFLPAIFRVCRRFAAVGQGGLLDVPAGARFCQPAALSISRTASRARTARTAQSVARAKLVFEETARASRI